VLSILVVACALALAGYLSFSRRVAASSAWRATATPLASIMGSGFLISAPLLAGLVGVRAVLFMAVLLPVAYALGGVMRFNIRHFEPIETDEGPARKVALASRVVLTAAYFVSVSYYLQLLAAFALHALGSESTLAARLVTSGLLLVIGGVGMWRGLDELEVIEKYAVSLNLGMIAALILALAWYNVARVVGGSWSLPTLDSSVSLRDARVLLGLLIIVQGFETSRYLGDEHPAELRVRTMRTAQLTASAVYLAFTGLATVLFEPDLGSRVTDVISMTAPVAVVLPALLTIAAVGSQFSAAVADTEGAGGLIEDLSRHRLKERYGYALILAGTVALTWVTDVTGIIAYASRAFALYYAVQCAVAWMVAGSGGSIAWARARRIGYAGLAVVCLAVAILGLPVE